MHEFRFEPAEMPAGTAPLREEVRAFLEGEMAAGRFRPEVGSMVAANADFSRRCGERGYIGMTWPREYGGHERSALERYIVTEEMLAAGAPVFCHWVADRQSGPQILAHGSARAKATILPEVAAGRCYFAIGMSEPDTGSDLASVRSKAVRQNDGWRITGRKVWTSNAHRAHYIIALVRTGGAPEQRQAGLTQFIIDLNAPGVTVRPIINIYGGHEFNEVIFDDVPVPEDMMLGAEGGGWAMVTSELAFERSGPDRFMSTFPLLVETFRALGAEPSAAAAADLGRMVADLATLRRMSVSIAGLLQKGEQPAVEAALVKDLGTTFEQGVPEAVRRLLPLEEAALQETQRYTELLVESTLQAPCYTLRGGTREILRGMVARGLGLR